MGGGGKSFFVEKKVSCKMSIFKVLSTCAILCVGNLEISAMQNQQITATHLQNYQNTQVRHFGKDVPYVSVRKKMSTLRLLVFTEQFPENMRNFSLHTSGIPCVDKGGHPYDVSVYSHNHDGYFVLFGVEQPSPWFVKAKDSSVTWIEDKATMVTDWCSDVKRRFRAWNHGRHANTAIEQGEQVAQNIGLGVFNVFRGNFVGGITNVFNGARAFGGMVEETAAAVQ